MATKQKKLDVDLSEDSPQSQATQIILQLLEKSVPMKLDALEQISGLDSNTFQETLKYLLDEGRLLINNAGLVIDTVKANLIVGVIQLNRSGLGFVLCKDGSSSDLLLDATESSKVLPGDIVLVKKIASRRNESKEKTYAEIVEVIKRPMTRIVGRIRIQKKIGILVPEDSRIYKEFTVDPGHMLGAQYGQVVVGEISNLGPLPNYPSCRIVEVLGDIDDPGMEIEIAVRKFEIPHEFSEATKKEIQTFSDQVTRTDLRNRIDLRDIPFVTIDGVDARDFDDAVYCKPLGPTRGWRLLVAIADVSHYVCPGSAIDLDAQSRTTSVYFPRRVIPMLPEELSNGLCSLNPSVDRCVLVCDAIVRPTGIVKAYQFYPAVMRSVARLTYDDVWAAIQNPKGSQAVQMVDVFRHVLDLYELFQVLLTARTSRGAMDFETTETYIVANEQGKIEQILPRERTDAHRLIEELMLVANTCASDFLLRNKVPCLYRVHEPPSEERIEKLRKYLNPLGLTLEGGVKPTTMDYSSLLQKIKDRPDKAVLQTAVLRSMQQAYYTPHNQGHFGLSYSAYTHFTSPIRRYPDLLVHRAIRAIVSDTKYVPKLLVPLNETGNFANIRSADEQKVANPEIQTWEKLGTLCSNGERRADEASYDVVAWLKCYYMKSHIGMVYQGTISSVAPFGIFVLLDDLYVEGSIHISELGADYYEYDEARSRLVGTRTREIFSVGDQVTIRVLSCDLDLRRIDFQLIDRSYSSKYKSKKRTRVGVSTQRSNSKTRRQRKGKY